MALNASKRRQPSLIGDAFFDKVKTIEQNDEKTVSLSLRKNAVTESMITQIVKSLQKSSYLRELDLSFCTLGDRGLEILIEGLKTNSTINRIDLRENDFTPAGAQKVFEVFQYNYTITTLELSEPQLEQDNSDALKKFSGMAGVGDMLDELNFPKIREKITRLIDSNRSIQECVRGDSDTLTLWNRGISDLPPIVVKLANVVTALELSKNNFTTFPPELITFKNLKILFFDDNELTEIPPDVAKLTNLVQLTLAFNSITTVPSYISLCANLEELVLVGNPIRSISESIGTMKRLIDFQLDGTHQLTSKETSIPKEIIARGSYDILTYYKNLTSSGKKKCYSTKMIILGNGNVGKTSLVSSLKHKASKKKYDDKNPNIATDGIDITQWILQPSKTGMPIEFSVWDFAGQEVYYSTHQFFISDRTIYIFVFNLLEDDETSRIEYWLNSISVRAQDAPILVVGTHLDHKKATKDLLSKRENDILKKWAPQFTNIRSYVPLSTLTGKNVDLFKTSLYKIASAQPHMGEELPRNYFHLQEKLEAIRFSQKVRMLNWKDYYEIALQCVIPPEDVVTVTKFLHNLGTILWFDEKETGLDEIIILDSEWLTTVFSTLITMKPNSVREGIIQIANLGHVWKAPEFPPERHHFFLALMEKFELCYIMKDGKNVLIPNLLPTEKPDTFEKFWPKKHTNKGPEIGRRYKLKFLPLGLFTRLMVRLLHCDWDPELYWRKGIILSHETHTTILMEQIGHDLYVCLRGPNAQKDLSSIVESIDTLLEDWLRVEVEKLVPCSHCLGEGREPYFFNLEECEKAVSKGQKTVKCNNGGGELLLEQLVPDVAMASFEGHKIEYKEFENLTQIGEGSFALVYLANWRGSKVAIKQLTNVSLEVFGEFRKEVWLMSWLKHPNLVELIGICLEPFCMVMEIMDKGSLFSYIHKDGVKLDWPLRIQIALDIAHGMNFLHSVKPPVIHRDLKSPNVLLKTEGQPRMIAKIADFGLSRATSFVDKFQGTSVDNPVWLAPEVIKKETYGLPVDVYAFGVMLWEILTQDFFFGEVRFMADVEDMILEGQRPPIPECEYEDYVAMIKEGWDPNPKNRYTFSQAIPRLENIKLLLEGKKPIHETSVNINKEFSIADAPPSS